MYNKNIDEASETWGGLCFSKCRSAYLCKLKHEFKNYSRFSIIYYCL